jgi:RNA recognition motif-containing protein
MRFNTDGNGGKTVRREREEPQEVSLAGKVNDSNKDRALCLRGLPFRVKMEEIIEFFEGFGKVTAEDVLIEEEAGRRSGKGLVFFENEDIAQDAKDALNKKEIGGRWIQIFDQHDDFMQQLCGLD